jgi:hypothetical protein
MKQEDFKSKVDLVNMQLENTEPESIEQYQIAGKDFTGYRTQNVVDAVNSVFGVEWLYDIVDQGTSEGKLYWVAMQVKFLVGNDWRYRGTQFGSGSAVGSDGDARKAAISDAIKKGLSLWSIGNKPYLGKLVAGGGVLIQKLNPLIFEVMKKTQRTEVEIKTDLAKFLMDGWHLKPSDLDNCPEDLRNHLMEEMTKRINNMEKSLI